MLIRLTASPRAWHFETGRIEPASDLTHRLALHDRRHRTRPPAAGGCPPRQARSVPAGHRGSEPEDAAHLPADLEGGPDRQHGAPARRERNGEGAGRATDPRAVAPGAWAVRAGPRRGDPREP